MSIRLMEQLLLERPLCRCFLHNDQLLLFPVTSVKNVSLGCYRISNFPFFSYLLLLKISYLLHSRRFYLTGDMTNLYPFIQGSLEWPFSELFSSNVSLWNQYKYIEFNIFSWRTLIISYKMLIITGMSNEKTN